jgi:sarcosine reductase
VNFVGVILAPSHRLIASEKERLASETAKMAQLLRADGAVITQESGGHGAVDLMLVCQKVEQAGIRTVVAMNELADADAPDLATPDIVPEATAIVSTGNREELVSLPAVERVLGGEALWDGTDAAESLRLPLRHVLCSTNQLGYGRMRADLF